MHDTATQEVTSPPADVTMFRTTIPGATIGDVARVTDELRLIPGVLEGTSNAVIDEAMRLYLDIEGDVDRIADVVDAATPKGTRRNREACDAVLELLGAITGTSDLWAVLLDMPGFDADAERHRLLDERGAAGETPGASA